MTKVYVVNYNNVMDGVTAKLRKAGRLATNPHEADVFLLWQDVRGECLELASIVKTQIKKPLVVLQHGRGATRDYGPPNKFPFLADKMLVWGVAEKARLLSYGVPEARVEVVGCPLFPNLRPKSKNRRGKNVLLAPVISSKEEPENLLVYAHLKKWESDKLIENLYELMPKFKESWAFEENQVKRVATPSGTEERIWRKAYHRFLPRDITYGKGLVNVKLTPVHDAHQYHSPAVVTGQNAPDHIHQTVNLLRNTDVLVCLEEGTMQLWPAPWISR